MKKKIYITLILILLIINFSCESNAEMEETIGFVCTPNISYANDISPLLNQNCKNCHFNGTQLPDLSTYKSVSENALLIRKVTQSRRMPKNGILTQDEIDAIACWVDNGALDN